MFPRFVAKEVCDVLGLEARFSTRYLDEDERTVLNKHGLTSSRNPNVTIISESGLYSLILRSRKPEARAFKRWITHDVIPSIRKDGGYIHTTPGGKASTEMTNEEIMAKAFLLAQATMEKQKVSQLTSQL
jgi:anti-repressor protein